MREALARAWEGSEPSLSSSGLRPVSPDPSFQETRRHTQRTVTMAVSDGDRAAHACSVLPAAGGQERALVSPRLVLCAGRLQHSGPRFCNSLRTVEHERDLVYECARQSPSACMVRSRPR